MIPQTSGDLKERHYELISELNALNTAEDKLSWLMERVPFHPAFTKDECSDTRKVPGCLSGLWLKSELRDGVCIFSAFSDSRLVGGIASYLCDLYSLLTPNEVLRVGSNLAHDLKLERLLSATRKRAVLSTLAFIINTAKAYQSSLTSEPAY